LFYDHLFLMVWLAQAGPSSGTSVVAVVVPHERIVLAADGLLGRYRGRSRYTPVAACKIFQFDNCSFSAAGNLFYRGTGFRLDVIGREACQTPGSLAAKVYAFESTATPAIRRVLRDAHDNHPHAYRRFLGKVFAETVFVGFEDGEPVLMVKSHTVDKDGVLQARPIARYTEGTLIFGSNQAALRFIDENRPLLKKLPAPEIARKLIEVEISENPTKVGPPISILAIDKNGASWIQRGACSR